MQASATTLVSHRWKEYLFIQSWFCPSFLWKRIFSDRTSAELLLLRVIWYQEVQPVSPRVLSLVEEKNCHRTSKNLTLPKLGVKINVLFISFWIALTLWVKIVWFGCQVTVCVKKRHTNAIFGHSWFLKFNFDCLLNELLISYIKTEHILSFVCYL